MTLATDLLLMHWAQNLDSAPKPVIKVSLDQWTGYADTGQRIYAPFEDMATLPEATTYQKRACCLFSAKTYLAIDCNLKPIGTHQTRTAHFTITGWVAAAQEQTRYTDTQLFGLVPNRFDKPLYTFYGCGKEGSEYLHGGLQAGGTVTGIRANRSDTRWRHFAMVLTVPPGWQNKVYSMDVYIDGQYKGNASRNLANWAIIGFLFGNTRATEGYDYYMRDLRVYKRALTPAQIAEMYDEDKPKPVVKVSLDQWTGYADTGQELLAYDSTFTGVPEATTYLDKKCCLFVPKTQYYFLESFKPIGNQQGKTVYFTICGWIAAAQTLVAWKGGRLFGLKQSKTGGNLYGAAWENRRNAITIGCTDNSTTIKGTTGANNTNWQHYAMTMTIPEGWQNRDYTVDCYIDGQFKTSVTFSASNTALGCFLLGNTRTSDNYRFYMRDIRVYKTALSEQEIQEIYEEGL